MARHDYPFGFPLQKGLAGLKNEQARKGRLRERIAVKTDRIFGLMNRIKEKDPYVPVMTILTFDKRGRRLNCYGKWIEAGILMHWLNLNCTKLGTVTTSKISYPSILHLSNIQMGYIVKASKLGLVDFADGRLTDFYIALVGIPVDDEDAMPFTLTIQTRGIEMNIAA